MSVRNAPNHPEQRVVVADIEKIRGVDNGTDGKRNRAYGLLRILMVCLTKLSGVKQ